MRSILRKPLLICMGGIVLSACSVQGLMTAQKKGENIDTVIADWGMPDNVFSDNNRPIGQLGFVWSSTRQYQYDQAVGTYEVANPFVMTGVSQGTVYQKQTGIAQCDKILYVDENGIVVDTETDGSCK